MRTTVHILGALLLLSSAACNSAERQISRAHEACVQKFKNEMSKIAQSVPSGKPGDPAGAFAQGMGQAMSGMVSGVGASVCDAMREQCRSNFEGQACKGFITSFTK